MKKVLLTCLGLLLASPIFAQFSLEQVLSSAFPSELKASPVKNQIAWVFNQTGSRNIFLAEAPDFKPRKLTNYEGDNGQEINSITFLPNGKSLLFIRGGANNSAGEIPNPAELQGTVERAIYKIDLDGKNLKKIVNGAYPKISPNGSTLAYISGGQIWTLNLDSANISPKKLFHSRGSQGSIRWSPDGSKIAFVSSRGDHNFIGVCDIATQQIKYIDPGVDGDIDPTWSPDGKSIAFIRVPFTKDALIFGPERASLPWSIRVVDLTTGLAKEIWKAQKGVGSNFFAGGLVAENHLFWTSDNMIIFPYEGDGWHHLYSVSASGGTAKLLTPDKGEVEYAFLANDKKTVIYNANIGDIDRRHIWSVTASGTPKQITTGQGIEWSPVQTSDGQLAILRSDAKVPARPSVVTSDGKIKDIAPEFIPNDFPINQLVVPQAVMITATDGMQIPAQLFLPKNHKAGEKHPAAIFFHGGSRRQMLLGFNYGEYYHKAYSLNQYLVSQGYIVLSVNYRSGIGYGMEFREAENYGATGASEYNDVVGAGLFLKSREDIDGSKIGLWGGSYGGYLTALGLAKASDLFAAGVDIHGVHDWNVVVKNFIPNYDANKRAEWAKVAYQSSPMPYINSWKSPVLLIHGDDDRNVPFSETVTIAEALRKNDVYMEQLIFPDEVHSFLLYQNWLNAYKATASFFDKFLKKK
ncbi:prolyl oligopeptidase family serine peptidase [Flectobacillus sp. DC10W]|jgi:dipeptidyl aminopeptidase/acylaminoacyl peptidase|uniref:Acyl-peptide hydrolase n=1 Tax=Flectobacillus longus TaxID=2984207 RepID=A0ABT6YIL7_9BACT|nr:prolyl oligopeptidase family serine peptidase [Flectobacillus longus]MDI9863437.1 prolyl oligopeptidase family serine peptidase [Flectobacillus longus]